jgi:predicted RNA binding protein YcfA (HicA-like mRNA interferase family)
MAAGRLLAQHGFVAVRQRGEHIVLQRQVEGTTVTVPIPNQAELKPSMLLSVIRQSGLPRELFEA